MKNFNFILFLSVFSFQYLFATNNLKNDIKILDLKPFDKKDLGLIFQSNNDLNSLTYKNRKKKKEKAAAIFTGLANAAASLAQAANGNPKDGVPNFIVNIFSTAAQIAQIEANYIRQESFLELKNYLIFNYIINMAESLYEIIKQDSSRDTNLTRFPILSQYSKITIYAQRAAWIANKIIENDFIQKLLREVFDYMQLYLHEKVDDFIDFLREKLLVQDSSKIENLSV